MSNVELENIDKFSCNICQKLCSLKSPNDNQSEEIWVCPLCHSHFCYEHREEHIKKHRNTFGK